MPQKTRMVPPPHDPVIYAYEAYEMAHDITEKMTKIQYKALFDKHMNAAPEGFS